MTRREFLRALEAQLDLPPGNLNEQQALANIDGWDSMAAVLFMALADEQVGVTVSGNQIAESKTVKDLLALLGDRLTD